MRFSNLLRTVSTCMKAGIIASTEEVNSCPKFSTRYPSLMPLGRSKYPTLLGLHIFWLQTRTICATSSAWRPTTPPPRSSSGAHMMTVDPLRIPTMVAQYVQRAQIFRIYTHVAAARLRASVPAMRSIIERVFGQCIWTTRLRQQLDD